VTDEPENTPPWASGVTEKPPSGLRRRKIIKGYCISSEEERSGESDCCLSEGETEETKACDSWEPSIPSDECPITPHLDTLDTLAYTDVPSTVSVIFPSLLPLTYVADNVSITSGASLASSAFDTLTYHRELREAQMDSDFDQILGRLLSEWYYTGASVSWPCCPPGPKAYRLTFHSSSFPLPRKYLRCVIFLLRDLITMVPRPHSVDTTVFGFSSDKLFSVDSLAKRSLIISSVAAAIGLFVDVWFIFAYSGADVRKFHVSSHSPTCERTWY
jgi:hypothetical protein